MIKYDETQFYTKGYELSAEASELPGFNAQPKLSVILSVGPIDFTLENTLRDADHDVTMWIYWSRPGFVSGRQFKLKVFND